MSTTKSGTTILPKFMTITTAAEVDEWIAKVGVSAERLKKRIAELSGDGLGLLRALKFEDLGFHPTEERELNALEQINQTWTYLVAFTAVRQLLVLHPEAGGFDVAPGAHMATPLDVMSKVPGAVGAETFAAVDPRNNRKLQRDLEGLIRWRVATADVCLRAVRP